MKHSFIILIPIVFCALVAGCANHLPVQLQAPEEISADVAFYAALEPSQRSKILKNKHIALSGTVSADGYTTLFIGDENLDGISFSCNFSDRTDALAAVRAGDFIQLHGICTGILGSVIFLDYCQLTDSSSIPESTAATVAPSTTQPFVQPTTEPGVPQCLDLPKRQQILQPPQLQRHA